ncbi:hypothetical protein G6F57_019973 [Rhizopus arrhizus]|nr:hypothetical protein G6F35_015475 [Rhizopus arrhizus]KAG1438135.1 hypothetical protein G6F57_019973 [Rhizopus arrhizus]
MNQEVRLSALDPPDGRGGLAGNRGGQLRLAAAGAADGGHGRPPARRAEDRRPDRLRAGLQSEGRHRRLRGGCARAVVPDLGQRHPQPCQRGQGHRRAGRDDGVDRQLGAVAAAPHAHRRGSRHGVRVFDGRRRAGAARGVGGCGRGANRCR